MPKYSFRDKQREIIFLLSEEEHRAFRRGRLHNEMFLPYSDLWRRRLLEGETWSLQKRIYSFTVRIVNAGDETNVIVMRPYSASVRLIPLRPYERTGKHIVLRLKSLTS